MGHDVHVERPQEIRHPRVGHRGHQEHVAQRLEPRALRPRQVVGTEQDHGAAGQPPGNLRHQSDVHAAGVNGAQVTRHRLRPRRGFRREGAGAVEHPGVMLRVDAVRDQVDVAGHPPLGLPELPGAGDHRVGGRAEFGVLPPGQPPLPRGGGKRDPVVRHVVNHPALARLPDQGNRPVVVHPEHRCPQPELARDAPDVPAQRPGVPPAPGGERVRQQLERAGDGDVGRRRDGPGRRGATEPPQTAVAQPVGDVPGRPDEEDLRPREASGEHVADKLVAAPHLVPVFQRDEDQVGEALGPRGGAGRAA